MRLCQQGARQIVPVAMVRRSLAKSVILPVFIAFLGACQSGIQIEPVGVAPSPVRAASAVVLREDRVTSEAVLHLRDQLTQNTLAQEALSDKLQSYQRQGYAKIEASDARAKRLANIFAKVHQRSHLADMALRPILIERDIFQAYTLGGLEIVFYTGLTDSLSDDGLAIIIGHEIAHIATSHALEAVSRDVVNLAHAHTHHHQDGMHNKTGAALAGFYQIEAEYEADMVGLLYASLAGYDPTKAAEIWQRLAEVKQRQKFNLFTATHPPDEARARRLAKWGQALIPLVGSADWRDDLLCNPLYCAGE